MQPDFNLPPIQEIQSKITSGGLLFICSPNNPTGNCIAHERIKEIAQLFEGIVVVDEAYIEFSETSSAVRLLPQLPNLVVLKTMSKAWGMAGARIGMAFGNPQIIAVLNKIKPPYNVNAMTQQTALEALKRWSKMEESVQEIRSEREKLKSVFVELPIVKKVYPSEANFLLVEFEQPTLVFQALTRSGIVVRNRSRQVKGCLRISIGTPDENKILINTLKNLQ